MTAQHREGKKKRKPDSSSKAKTKHFKRSGQRKFLSLPPLPLSRSHSNPVSPRKPEGQLTRTPGVPCTRPVHASRTFHRGPSRPSRKQTTCEAGLENGVRKRALSWLALEPDGNKRRQGGKHTVPCNLITSVRASGLHTRGR